MLSAPSCRSQLQPTSHRNGTTLNPFRTRLQRGACGCISSQTEQPNCVFFLHPPHQQSSGCIYSLICTSPPYPKPRLLRVSAHFIVVAASLSLHSSPRHLDRQLAAKSTIHSLTLEHFHHICLLSTSHTSKHGRRTT